MSTDLFSSSAVSADFVARAISPKRELGAYEALWAREGTWFKSIAEDFRTHEGAIIAVVDDVLNSGKHFKVAQDLVSQRFPGVPVIGIFLARCIRSDTHVA